MIAAKFLKVVKADLLNVDFPWVAPLVFVLEKPLIDAGLFAAAQEGPRAAMIV